MLPTCLMPRAAAAAAVDAPDTLATTPTDAAILCVRLCVGCYAYMLMAICCVVSISLSILFFLYIKEAFICCLSIGKY